MRYLINLFFIFLLQTVFLSKYYTFVAPDLFLILLAIYVSAKGLKTGLIYGSITGLVASLFANIPWLTILIYIVCGIVFSSIAKIYFQNHKILSLVNILLGTIIFYMLYILAIAIFMKSGYLFNIKTLLIQLFANFIACLLVYNVLEKPLNVLDNDR